LIGDASSETRNNPALASPCVRTLSLDAIPAGRCNLTTKTQLRRRFFIWLFVSAGAFAVASPALSLVGTASEDQSFAGHVVMVLKRGAGTAGFCTGVVLAPQVVLTAAHCAAPIKDMRVYYKDEAGRAAIVDVQAVAIHPGFRADALTSRAVSIDLALVQTRTPLDAHFSAAKLDEAGAVAVGQAVRIVGYGVAREGEGASGGVLRSALLQVRAPLSAILLWAEDPSKSGAGACSGDSGGPILSADGANVLAITTWSAGAGKGSHCGAVTQGPLVAPQRGWIDSVLNRWRL
jgi:Trypsin